MSREAELKLSNVEWQEMNCCRATGFRPDTGVAFHLLHFTAGSVQSSSPTHCPPRKVLVKLIFTIIPRVPRRIT
jgi:hypothetical protein